MLSFSNCTDQSMSVLFEVRPEWSWTFSSGRVENSLIQQPTVCTITVDVSLAYNRTTQTKWTSFLQFACHSKCSAVTVALALHSILRYLDNHQTHAQRLLWDYSSIFNTIRALKLTAKLADLRVAVTTLNFLTDRPQTVRMEKMFCWASSEQQEPHRAS